ncbi:cbb3-type cytochrome c oxidase subunit II [Horticoccus sp. 23ND18S-11]|uniref:cbb3-type cytochrome c oxidase subunit II n=1 Tax=Horticoccus sp. 23ND18S-11 TaxID=3391832 RepID=UPI0039C9D093
MTAPDSVTPTGGRTAWWAALAAVAATYVYFLIFAEFALLELSRVVAPTPASLRGIMTGLGAGGVIGALVAARTFRADRYPMLLAWAFRACALSAAAALLASSLAAMVAAAGAVGLSLGWLTVILTAGLRTVTGTARLGLAVGMGTGAAYAICNVPLVFRAPASVQTGVAVAVVIVASWLPRWMTPVANAARGRTAERRESAAGVACWVVVLLALVWMDSAAFYIVQHTASLRAATWGDGPMLFANAAVHLGAAALAGAWLDRGGRVAVIAGGTAALATACLMLENVVPAFVPAAWFYTAGVSLYSTVLVEFPARQGGPGVAAIVFAVAGWLGSALGIGMAQDLARVPVAFVVVAVGTIAAALLWRRRTVRQIVPLAIAAAVTTCRVDAGEPDALERLGREVYIAEGCIHCHSQYIRPRVAADVEFWGPAASLAESLTGAPPLLGARRMGPDLSHVGNRRSPEWNRLHLIAPRAVSPGSRMPAYVQLFSPGEIRGEALVAYLATLGAATVGARQAQIAAWVPAASDVTPLPQAQRLFLQLCAPCHGEKGGGDGAIAGRLSMRPPNWGVTPWRFVGPAGDTDAALARIIKFGLPGLPMAGHEYLPDRDVVGLARYVRTLHKARSGGSPVADQQ